MTPPSSSTPARPTGWILAPVYDVPVDGMNTLPAQSGIRIGLSVEGHAG
ncbi:hypothetical protein [Streptomyces sp. NBC_00316]|nr:hypothetical protein [Streptomyces sp. NBC_00316]